MLYEHPTISDCGTNRVRWRQQLISNGKRRRDRQKKLRRAWNYDYFNFFPYLWVQKFPSILFERSQSILAECLSVRWSAPPASLSNCRRQLVSYQRASKMLPERSSGHAPACVEWIPSTLIPLNVYLQSRLGTSTGIGFIDSTSMQNLRFSPP